MKLQKGRVYIINDLYHTFQACGTLFENNKTGHPRWKGARIRYTGEAASAHRATFEVLSVHPNDTTGKQFLNSKSERQQGDRRDFTYIENGKCCLTPAADLIHII